jgi:cytochrome c oxidase assembly protein subunit 15
LFIYTRKMSGNRELTRSAAMALGLVVLQILSGWLLTETLDNEDVYVFTALLHTFIICILFNTLCSLAVRAYQLSRRR